MTTKTYDNEPIVKLYDTVKEQGLYTKSLDEFKTKYNNPESISNLYNVVNKAQLYTKSKDEFLSKYFPAPVEKKSQVGGVSPSIGTGEGGLVPLNVSPEQMRRVEQDNKRFNIGEGDVATMEEDPIKAATMPYKKEAESRYSNYQKGIEKARSETVGQKYLSKVQQDKVNRNDAKVVHADELALGKFQKIKDQAVNELFPNGEVAKQAIQNYADKKGIPVSEVPESNETIKAAKEKAKEYDMDAADIAATGDINNAAILAERRSDPNFDAKVSQWEKEFHSNDYKTIIPEALYARVVDKFLSKGNAGLIAEHDPDLKAQYDHLKDGGILLENPTYGASIVANEMSRKREEEGKNNALGNLPRQKYMDDLAARMYADNPAKKKIYDDIIRQDLPKYIDTPGFLDRAVGAVKHGFEGTQKSISGLAGEDNAYALYNQEQDANTQVSAAPKGLWHQISGTSGDFGGLIAYMGLSNKVLEGAGLSKGASNLITTAHTFYGDELAQARSLYPDDPTKQKIRAALSTAAFMALNPLMKSAKGLQSKFFEKIQPEIDNMMADIEKGVSKEAARDSFIGKVKDAVDYLGSAAKNNATAVGEMSGLTLLKQGTDKLLGLSPEQYRQVHPEDEIVDVAKMTAMGLAPVSLLSAGGKRTVKNNIYDVASNPTRFKNVYTTQELTNPDFWFNNNVKKEDVDFLGKTKANLDDVGLPEKLQKSYLLHSMNERVLQRKAETIEEPTLKKSINDQIKRSQEAKEKILKGDNVDALPQEVNTDNLKEHEKFLKEMFQGDEDGSYLKAADQKLLGGKTFDKDKVPEFLETVAMQSNNVMRGKDGELIVDDKFDSRKSAEERWDKAIIDAANEMYPEFKKLGDTQGEFVSAIKESSSTPMEATTEGAAENVVPSTLKDVEVGYLSGENEIRGYDWKNLKVEEGDIFRGVEDNDILSAELPMFSENPMVALEYSRAEKGAGKYIQQKNSYNEGSKVGRYSIKKDAKILDTTKDLAGVNELKKILGKPEINESDYKWRGGWKVWGHIDNITKEGIQKLKDSGYDAVKIDETDRDTGIGKVDGASYVILNKNSIIENPLKQQTKPIEPVSETKETTTEVPDQTKTTITEPSEPNTPIPPTEEGTGAISDGGEKKTGIKNAVSRESRVAFDLPKVELPKIGTDLQRIAEGKAAVDSGEINPQQVVDNVLAGKGKIGMHPKEAAAMQYYMHQLGRADDLLHQQLALDLEPTERANLVSQRQQLSDLMDAATEANMLAGTAWSDVGNTRQILVDQSFNPSREKSLIKDAYGGEIPKDAKLKIDTALKERDEAIAQRNKLEEQLREKEAALKAAQMSKEGKKTKPKGDFKERISALKDELKAAKDEHDQWLKDQGIQKSGVGFTLTGKMAKVIGKIAAEYAKEGYKTVEELITKVYDEVKGHLTGIDRKDIRDAIAMWEAEKLTGKAERLEEKADNPTEPVSKLKLKFKTNTAWVAANQRVANAEYKIKVQKRLAYESQKNMFQKGLMWAGRLTRLSVLSGYNVLYKLAAAATIGGAGKRSPEQMIGRVYQTVFKGIAERAPIEGYINAKSEAKFYKEFFNPKKFVKNSWQILKTGESDLNKRFGAGGYEHVPLLYLPTDLHQVIKDPVKRATYEASLRNSMIWAEKNGLDINDPLVINTLETAAYKRGNYEIFQEQNWLSRKFSAWKGQMEKAGNAGATAKFLADFMIPVSTVPTNIVRRLVTTSPFGLIRGGKMVVEAYRKGIENLEPEQADAVMKQLKQGSLGTALWLVGWFGAASFGGLYSKYNPNKERDEGELASDEMEVNGQMIPKPVQHALPFEIIQWAATARHIYDNYKENKGASTFQSIYEAGMGSIGAVAEHIPIIETASHVVGSFKNPYEAEKLKEDVTRRFQPQILRETGIIPKAEKPATGTSKKQTKSQRKDQRKQTKQ